MKKTWAFLGLLLISVAAYAALDWEIPNNVMKMGDGTNATAKSFEMKMGLGASNPILSSLDGTEMNINIPFRVQGALNVEGAGTFQGDGTFDGSLSMGDGSAVDRTLLVDRGGSNPFLRWDESAGAWIFSNDGTLEKKIGSGSGGGAGGVNLLLNASFEDPGSPILNWSINGGILTQEDHTNGREGNLKFARFVSSASGEFVESDAVTISDDIGPGCMADVKYKQGDDVFEYKVLKAPYADPADVVTSGTFSDLTEFTKAPTIVFPCSGGDQFKFRVTSTAAGTIDLDEAYLGSNKGFVDGQGLTQFSIILETNGSSDPILISDPSGVVQSVTKISNSVWEINTGSKFTNTAECQAMMQIDDTSYLRCDNNVATDPNLYRLEIFANNHTNRPFGDFNGVPKVFGVRIGSQDPNNTQEAFSPEQADFLAIANVTSGSNLSLGTTFSETTISGGFSLVNLRGSCEIACAGTEESSGTTCSGSESVGVSCNLPRAGRYEVCADTNVYVNGGNASGGGSQNIIARIVQTENNSQTIIQSFRDRVGWSSSTGGVAGSDAHEATQKPCAVFDIASPGKKTFRHAFRGVSSGSGNNSSLIFISASDPTDVKYTIKMLDHNVSRPIVNNMVDTSVKTGLRTEACDVQLSGTINNASGLCGWVDSISPIATGRATVNFATGTFSNVVTCTGNNRFGGSKIIAFNNHTASSVEVLNYSDAGALENATVSISCKGER